VKPISPDAQYQPVIDKTFEAAQEHVFAHWGDLTDEERLNLLQDLDRAEFDLMRRLTDGFVDGLEEKPEVPDIVPPSVIPAARTDTELARQGRARAVGEEVLLKGSLAVLIVAGGQASRMGIDTSKGCYPISPVVKKSLFQLQAEKVLALSLRHGVSIPLIIMTSEDNDAEVREFFRAHDFFGISPSDMFFIVQRSLPAVDFKGKFILATKASLFFSPDGHGGAVRALKTSELLDDLLLRGIDNIFYLQVDNPLVKIGDPVFLGYHAEAEAEMSLKVVTKRSPEEKVGILAWMSGRLEVIEYTDLSAEQMYARDPSGELRFAHGSIAIHILNTQFVKRIADEDEELPFHIARKRVPFVDQSGNEVRPTEPNAIKFERFIFDLLPLAKSAVAVETLREEEFAPVKEQGGEDSPEVARRAISELHAGWLERCGIELPRRLDGTLKYPVEISPLFASSVEDLMIRLRGRHFKVPGPLYVGADFLSRRGL
jgi:UDP-N-acetylglucosamine/UDP-N-acetylgalactosamine diphosphorylase